MNQHQRCPECGDNGLIIDAAAATWDLCSCPRGVEVGNELRQAIEDMESGRAAKWSDIRVDA